MMIKVPGYSFSRPRFYQTILFGLFLTISCSPGERSYTSYFDQPHSGSLAIAVKTVEFDTLKIELDSFDFSYEGMSAISEDSIYLIDQSFSNVYVFDQEGKYMYQRLGRGHGPGEIEIQIDAACFLKDGRKAFFGSTDDQYVYDASWNRLGHGFIEWTGEISRSEVAEVPDPDPDWPALYGFEYEKFKVVGSNLDADLVFAPIYSEQKGFNGFVSESYYTHGRILATLSLSERKLMNMDGRRSPMYLEKTFLGHHSFFAYDIGPADDLYITHEIDSLIYHYDRDFNLLAKYGYAGKDMDTNYTAISDFDLDKIRELYFEERPNKGYYDGLYYSKENNMLFRSYKRGSHRDDDGLQIYSGSKLIGDVIVPKGFKLSGYIDPYYYSEVILDEIAETGRIYKFEL